MSRSYKKNPVYTDSSTPGTKISKRFANKKVRHLDLEELPTKGKGYKKYFCSYDIHDYKNRWTLEEAIDCWNNPNKFYRNRYESLKDFLNYWAKLHKRK